MARVKITVQKTRIVASEAASVPLKAESAELVGIDLAVSIVCILFR